MTFNDLVASASLFIDANTFVYHFRPHPTLGMACADLLGRIKRGELFAATSTHVANDVAHRVMTIEAVAKFGWPVAGIAQRLRKHPAEIMQLSLFRRAIDDINRFGVRMVVPPASINSAAAVASQQYGLLSGDALIAAIMQHALVAGGNRRRPLGYALSGTANYYQSSSGGRPGWPALTHQWLSLSADPTTCCHLLAPD